MVTTMTGPNTFFLHYELRQKISLFLNEHDSLALERIDGEEASMEIIREALISLPFLTTEKLVVLRAPSANKQFLEQAETILAAVNDTTQLIIVEPKLDKRSAYYKLLKKTTDYREYPELDSNGLAAWLVRTAKEQGGIITSNNARYLIERVGPNQQLLANELDKLLLHATTVNREAIDLLTEPAPQSTIFQLLEAAFAGNAKQTLSIYREQRALKVEAPQIVAMLTWQLHIIAIIKAAGSRTAADIAKDAKLSPYVVQKSMAIARQLPLADLKQQITDLLDIDLKSKRSNLDTDEALQLYLIKLAAVRQ